jgi:hypothetical protein
MRRWQMQVWPAACGAWRYKWFTQRGVVAVVWYVKLLRAYIPKFERDVVS